MKVSEVKVLAKQMGIVATNVKKSELIRMIQKAEGNYPCFESAQGGCDQVKCCWREDCLAR